MLVWRLENMNGLGLYRCDVSGEVLADYETETRPLPCDDKKLFDSFKRINIDLKKHLNGKFLFCFNSPYQLIKWFNKASDIVDFTWKLGVYVTAYDVPDGAVLEGESQCAFHVKFHIKPADRYTGMQFISKFNRPLQIN